MSAEQKIEIIFKDADGKVRPMYSEEIQEALDRDGIDDYWVETTGLWRPRIKKLILVMDPEPEKKYPEKKYPEQKQSEPEKDPGEVGVWGGDFPGNPGGSRPDRLR